MDPDYANLAKASVIFLSLAVMVRVAIELARAPRLPRGRRS